MWVHTLMGREGALDILFYMGEQLHLSLNWFSTKRLGTKAIKKDQVWGKTVGEKITLARRI